MMKQLFLTATMALLVAAPAWAQQRDATPENRWQPWLGCWQLLDETVQDESDVSAAEVATGAGSSRASRAANGTRVCVSPTTGGVTMATMIGTQRALEEIVLADGRSHAISDDECRGTKRSEWSARSYRLYTTAEISCADQPARNVSSLSMMTPGPTWVDVQMIDISGRKSIRVRKFMRMADQPRVAAFATEAAWTLDDVKEASAKLAPETVQAALVELESGFTLSSKQLVSLADSGVPESVIDLMIALSYPEKFVVSHPVSTAPPPYGYAYGGLGGAWPWIADADFWPSYYSPFAYRYWGYYDPYYVPSSGYVYLTPITSGGGGTTGPQPSGEGRVVDGRGYTRVTTREPEPSIRANNFGGSNGTTSTGGSGSSGSGGGNSGVSSTGGYSSGGGGSSSDSGRTAVPRPPGGN